MEHVDGELLVEKPLKLGGSKRAATRMGKRGQIMIIVPNLGLMHT